MNIYIIYEENGHGDYSSMIIKHITTNKAEAIRFWFNNKESYGPVEDYEFVLAIYEGSEYSQDSFSNILRDLEIIKSTENEE